MTASVPRLAVAVVAILMVAALLLPFFHVGFQASDDAGYLGGALGWLERFPYVGHSHWTLRHTITLPVAASVSLFGLSELSVSLPNVVYFALFLVVNTIAAGRVLGLGTALISGLLLATMPGFLVVATYLSPDIPELFYLSIAFWAFVIGCRRPESLAPWLICGVAWALAFLNRQTALGFAALPRPDVPVPTGRAAAAATCSSPRPRFPCCSSNGRTSSPPPASRSTGIGSTITTT